MVRAAFGTDVGVGEDAEEAVAPGWVVGGCAGGGACAGGTGEPGEVVGVPEGVGVGDVFEGESGGGGVSECFFGSFGGGFEVCL